MTSELIVGGALANCGRDTSTDEFLQLLAREVPDLAIFRLRPRPSHLDVRAALDWQAILTTGASLLTFADVLWKVYERFVKPKLDRSDGKSKPFLFINVRRPDGAFVQFAIGNEFKDKDIFVEQFTRKLTELRTVAGSEEEKHSSFRA